MKDREKSISRRYFLKTAAAGTTGLCVSSYLSGCQTQSQYKSPEKKHNIVVIVSDDQGYGDLRAFGNNPHIHTPNLDKLYRQSTSLDNFIVSPLCAPTRASLMTGRYNYRTGVWDAWMGRLGLHEDEITLAEVLKGQGYNTGIFGKWHLGFNCPMRPQDNGFDEVILWTHPMTTRYDPLLTFNGEIRRAKGYLTDIFFDNAIAFIDKNRDRPFFAYIPSFLPHDNTDPQVSPEYIEMYKDLDFLTQGDKEVYAMITKLDENVGRILKKLAELDIEDSTIVLFFSDNGPLKLCPDLTSKPEIIACETHDMGDRYNCNLRGGKTNVYEGGIKTPCFIKGPGISAGKNVDTMIAHIDIKPTLLGLCGLKDHKGLRMDGMDFSEMLSGREQHVPERSIIIQSHRVEVPRMWENSCVRQQRWKLVNGVELYDLQNDPSESTNISGLYPQKTAELRKIYENWYKDIVSKDPFVPGTTHIGSDVQPEVHFSIWHRHSKGWPVKVIKSGIYEVTIDGIQQNLFGDDSVFNLTFGNKTYKAKIAGAGENIVINDIFLEAGKSYFDINCSGYKKPAKMYYGNEDFGYREIKIRFVG